MIRHTILDRKISIELLSVHLISYFRVESLFATISRSTKRTTLHVITNHSYYPITLDFKQSNDMQGGKLYTTYSMNNGSPVFYLRSNLLNIKVPTISAADKINPR